MIQHLILEGRTSDAIEKTKELFPTLLNDKNLLFALKVRQFIEMINGTESEIVHSLSPSTNNCTSLKSGFQTQKNGIIHQSSHRPIVTHRQSNRSTEKETPTITDLMDIDDDDDDDDNNNNQTTRYSKIISNGFTHHTQTMLNADGDVSFKESLSNNNSVNGYLVNTTTVDGIDSDAHDETVHKMDTVSTSESGYKDEYLLLSRILQFGRELHTLKQQLTSEYGENSQNDKMLQVQNYSLGN